MSTSGQSQPVAISGYCYSPYMPVTKGVSVNGMPMMGTSGGGWASQAISGSFTPPPGKEQELMADEIEYCNIVLYRNYFSKKFLYSITIQMFHKNGAHKYTSLIKFSKEEVDEMLEYFEASRKRAILNLHSKNETDRQVSRSVLKNKLRWDGKIHILLPHVIIMSWYQTVVKEHYLPIRILETLKRIPKRLNPHNKA
jgi:hypothetical protein